MSWRFFAWANFLIAGLMTWFQRPYHQTMVTLAFAVVGFGVADILTAIRKRGEG